MSEPVDDGRAKICHTGGRIMNESERLNELLADLSKWTGKRLRWKNEVTEQFGSVDDASLSDQIKVAEQVLNEPCRGWAGGKAEEVRATRLGTKR